MSLDDVLDSGARFVSEVRRFYDEANQRLAPGIPLRADEVAWLEELLTPALENSEEVRRKAEEALAPIPRGEEYELMSIALLGAAALDAMLASELALWDSELLEMAQEPPTAEWEEEWEYLDEEPAPDPERIATMREETLRSVEAALGGGANARAGSAAMDASRGASIARAVDATATLVTLAVAPSRSLVSGLMTVATAGAVDILAAAEHVDPVPGMQTAANCLHKHAPRFLREHVAKVSALRADARVVGEVARRIKEKVSPEELLVLVAAAKRADQAVEASIRQAIQFTEQTTEDLNADLLALTQSYGKQTDLIGKSARWLRWGATPLAHLVAPIVGHAVVGGIFLVGVGYVAYSLTDRIDGRKLGIADRVEGVVRLVEKRAEHR